MLTAAGLVPFTTIDFPGKLAAVIFLQGCPLKCPFCHNKSLQIEGTPTTISRTEIESFLMQRTKQLDGIVLSGGEPLKHKEVKDLIQKIKALGYKVAIHTSGVYPEHLAEVLPLLDWVGLDIKAPWEKYKLLCGRPNMATKVQESLKLLQNSGIKFECRTTCDPRYLDIQDIEKIGKYLKEQGVKTYVLQHYRTFEGDINPPQNSDIESFFKNKDLQNYLQVLFPSFSIR